MTRELYDAVKRSLHQQCASSYLDAMWTATNAASNKPKYGFFQRYRLAGRAWFIAEIRQNREKRWLLISLLRVADGRVVKDK